MEECYEIGLKVGGNLYMEEVVEEYEYTVRRCDEEKRITPDVMERITKIIMKSKRNIPRNIFDDIEHLSAFIRGMYNTSKKYKRCEDAFKRGVGYNGNVIHTENGDL